MERESAKSRGMRAVWGASNDEGSRAYLQERMTLLFQIMFWAFVVLIAAQAILWELLYADKPYRPVYQNQIYVIATTALTLLAVIWRGILLRRTLTIRQLYWLDLFFGVGCGVVLGSAAPLAYNFIPSHYVCLIYALLGVFTRAIVIPSSGRWTALVTAGTFAPMMIAAVVLAASDVELVAPKPLFVSGAFSLAGLAVLLASIGSRTIYGLREQAMQLGQYTLEREIGAGGMGRVYRARHVMLRRPTAVKLLRPELVGDGENLALFEREVQSMSQLTHPNTVAVFDYGRSPDGVFYYAMEYLGDGIDLQRLVAKYGRQPIDRVVHILDQVCRALREAHDKKLIHRDIKPPNIILCERGGMLDVAKVVDFGLVEGIAEEKRHQVIFGTPAFLAPEIIAKGTIGPAADLYALGAVGYFLLTGTLVFDGDSAAVCAMHLGTQPQPMRERGAQVPPQLEAIVMRCLDKDPQRRFASAAELAEALAEVPRAGDWSEQTARAWWDDHDQQTAEREQLSAARTITISVDVGRREGSAREIHVKGRTHPT